MKTIEQIARELGDDWDATLPEDKVFIENVAKVYLSAWLEQQSQEPVAYMAPTGTCVTAEDVSYTPSWANYYTIPLYAAPPALSDRMLEAAKELKGKLDSTEQRLQRRMKDIQEQAKRYVTLESNCQAIAAQNEALRDALEELMRWQVQNMRVWSNSAYDNAHRTITSLPNLAAQGEQE